VEAAGGRLTVSSRPGEGTHVSATLPSVPTAPRAQPTAPAA